MKTISKQSKIIVISLLVAIALLGGGIAYASWARNQTTGTTASQVESTIDIDNGDEDIDWAALPTTDVTLGTDTLSITAAGTYVVSGSTTAGVTVASDGNVRLILNGASISSTDGPAIYIESAENTVVQLASGTTNTVADTTTYTDDTLEGALYSADDLIIEGEGTLNVTGNYADGIVSNDDLKILSGTIAITAVDDAIRGNDSVNIVDGTITVEAGGDGIKATNAEDVTKGYVYIQNGTVTVTAADDGIHAEEKLIINGGTVSILESVEGLEGATVTINNGVISVNATDDGINAPGSTFTAALITFNGGTVDVTVGNGDTDAIDANGAIVVNGGTITVTAPTSSFDYDTTATLNGGTVIINGETVTEIPEGMMMGGGGGRR